MPFSAARLCARAVAQIGRPAELLTASSASCHLLSHRVTLSPLIASGTALTTARPYSTAVCRVGGRCCRQCDRVSAAGTLFHTHARTLSSSSKSPCEHTDSDTLSQMEPLCHSDDESSDGSCHSDSDADVSVFKTPISQLDPEALYAALGCVDDAKVRRSVDLILLEYNCLMLDNQPVPTYIRFNDWLALVKMDTASDRSRYLKHLQHLEQRRKRNDADSHLASPEMYAGISDCIDSTVEPDCVEENSLFLPLDQREINLWQSMRLWQAMVHGPRLVIDMRYDNTLSFQQLEETVTEVKQCVDMIAASRQPFDIHLCNVHADTPQHQLMRSLMPAVSEDSNCFLHVHSCSYMEVFDKDRMVYLSPHSREELVSLDDDTVYIVGGLVNLIRSPTSRLSMKQATDDGIRAACLPLKSYVKLGGGFDASLRLPQLTKILLALVGGASWPEAFKSIPKTYLKSPNDLSPSQKKAIEREKIARLLAENKWRKRSFR